MNAKISFYITTAIIVLIIGAWAYFFYLPYINVISEQKEKINKIKSQIKRSAKVSQDLDETKNRLSAFQNQVEDQKRRIITQSDLDNVAAMFSQEMERYDIKIINISPLVSHFLKINKNTKTEYSKLPIEVDIESKYLKFGHFLDNIYNLPIYIHPEAISISPITPKDNLLAIKLTISVYVKSES